MSRFHFDAVSSLELDGVDLSGYLADVQPNPGTWEILDALPSSTMTLSGYWDTLPGLGECSMTFVVPPWMLEPRYRKRLALFLDPVGYRRRRRMRTAYHLRRR